MELRKCPAIIILTGASGAGKTALILKLNELAIPGVEAINCDRADVPDCSEPSDRQADVLRYWLDHLRAKPSIYLAVLDTQIRPHRAREVLDQAGIIHSQIVLVNCEPAIRNERLLRERNQPELANPRMDCWAAYLRGQADALNLSIIDTSNDSLDVSCKMLEGFVRQFLDRTRKL